MHPDKDNRIMNTKTDGTDYFPGLSVFIRVHPWLKTP